MLRDELTNEDIPHHSTLQNRIDEVFGQHLTNLGKEMRQVCIVPQRIYNINSDILRTLSAKYR